MKSVYLICAKCGSDELVFDYDEGNDEERMDCTYIRCLDCATLTFPSEFNERLSKSVRDRIAKRLQGALDEESSS